MFRIAGNNGRTAAPEGEGEGGHDDARFVAQSRDARHDLSKRMAVLGPHRRDDSDDVRPDSRRPGRRGSRAAYSLSLPLSPSLPPPPSLVG